MFVFNLLKSGFIETAFFINVFGENLNNITSDIINSVKKASSVVFTHKNQLTVL